MHIFSQERQNAEHGHKEIITDLLMKHGIADVRPLHGCELMDSCLVNLIQLFRHSFLMRKFSCVPSFSLGVCGCVVSVISNLIEILLIVFGFAFLKVPFPFFFFSIRK